MKRVPLSHVHTQMLAPKFVCRKCYYARATLGPETAGRCRHIRRSKGAGGSTRSDTNDGFFFLVPLPNMLFSALCTHRVVSEYF